MIVRSYEYRPTGTRVRSDLNKELNILAATLERTKQDLMEEAILDLLEKYEGNHKKLLTSLASMIKLN